MARIAVVALGALLLWSEPGTPYARGVAGKRVKVTGHWNGRFVEAARIQHRDPKKDPQKGRVKGHIDAIDTETATLQIGPVRVQLTRSTRFDGIQAEELLPGTSINAIGHLHGPGTLIAETIEPASVKRSYIQILGAVTSGLQRPDGTIHMVVLGVPVKVPQEIYDRGLSLIRHPDDKRPDKQLTLSLFGRSLTVGGELGTTSGFRGAFKLRPGAEDDQVRLDQGFELELFYRPAPNVSIFIEGKTFREAVFKTESDERETEQAFKRGEAWIYMGDLLGSGIALQAGRQNFREGREWWWDEDLDALRIYYLRPRFHAEVAVAKELDWAATAYDRADPEEKDILRVLGRVSWAWLKKQRLDLFLLRHDDFSGQERLGKIIKEDEEDPSDAGLLWLGARLSGELGLGSFGEIEYRIDAARVSGYDTLVGFREMPDDRLQVYSLRLQRVEGWALDAGLSWSTNLPGHPTLTFGYAIGSGDNGRFGLARDRSFRQTGLHDNNDRFNGVDRFRYYGELLRPELSNLRIWTASIGLPLWRSSSIELIFHKYRQQYPAPFLRSTKIKARPNGLRPEIGEEWDVVIGIEESQHIEVEIVASLFRAGPAFGPLAGRLAYQTTLKLDFNF